MFSNASNISFIGFAFGGVNRVLQVNNINQQFKVNNYKILYFSGTKQGTILLPQRFAQVDIVAYVL